MAEMLFYERVAPLHNENHATLKLRPVTRFNFAAKTNSVPLLASEFFDVAREYPIFFGRTPDGPVPAVLLGLRENENLYVDNTGRWNARYLPAFVRRYPFLPGKGEQGQLIVCIDEASPALNTKEGQPLFVDGKPGDLLNHAMQFLSEFQQAAQTTELVCRQLDTWNLLRPADSLAQLNDGQQFRLNGLYVVDEERYRALAPDAVQALFASGGLGLVYAHLLSLGNMGPLMDRLSQRVGQKKPLARH